MREDLQDVFCHVSDLQDGEGSVMEATEGMGVNDANVELLDEEMLESMSRAEAVSNLQWGKAMMNRQKEWGFKREHGRTSCVIILEQLGAGCLRLSLAETSITTVEKVEVLRLEWLQRV